MKALVSCVYEGQVVHRRLRPHRHRLDCSVFALLLDLDELPQLDARLRLFAYIRLQSSRDCQLLRSRSWRWFRRAIAGMGGTAAACRAHRSRRRPDPAAVLPAHPGVCVQSPEDLLLSLAGRTSGHLVYEVNNTFGQRHCYVIPAGHVGGGAVHQECAKQFYVSPFIAMDRRYRFRVTRPGSVLTIAITVNDANGPMLCATFSGRRVPLDDRRLASVLLRYPLLTLKVIGSIHWEALRLWLKGVPLVHRPLPPAEPMTIVSPRI